MCCDQIIQRRLWTVHSTGGAEVIKRTGTHKYVVWRYYIVGRSMSVMVRLPHILVVWLRDIKAYTALLLYHIG